MSDETSGSGGNNSYLLGEISATVKGTAEDVKAIRTDVGDLARRVGIAEREIGDIKSNRAAMIPEYTKFVHKVNNYLQTDIAWKSAHDAETSTGRRHLYVIGVIIGLLASLGGAMLKVAFG